MLFALGEPIEKQKARLYSPLTLAFMGDCVFDLLVRSKLTSEGNIPPKRLHCKASSLVSAEAQSLAVTSLIPYFTEEEMNIFKRGRNAKSHSTAKNMTICDYRRATGLEALFGYLYLTGSYERIEQLFKIIMDSNDNEDKRD